MAERPATISGTVRDASGKPIAGASVYFIEGPVPLPDVAALTDPAGRFVLSAPVGGNYRIGCRAEAGEPTEASLSISAGHDHQTEIVVR